MEKQNCNVKLLIDFEEYNLLLKKADLYDKKVSANLQTGGSLTEIVAKNTFEEGLIEKPTGLVILLEFFLSFI